MCFGSLFLHVFNIKCKFLCAPKFAFFFLHVFFLVFVSCLLASNIGATSNAAQHQQNPNKLKSEQLYIRPPSKISIRNGYTIFGIFAWCFVVSFLGRCCQDGASPKLIKIFSNIVCVWVSPWHLWICKNLKHWPCTVNRLDSNWWLLVIYSCLTHLNFIPGPYLENEPLNVFNTDCGHNLWIEMSFFNIFWQKIFRKKSLNFIPIPWKWSTECFKNWLWTEFMDRKKCFKSIKLFGKYAQF